ncbi:RHS repeat domain-containing protein [Luteimonas aquatica]|uniref:RHS repeat domain-containing protein n=1 Tax=Luteimonas aquatica TaxID=450364 RepID=UPI001F5950C1|nr:RHS repeat-associated core domain-containing protein [Luteimonas aquatica]
MERVGSSRAKRRTKYVLALSGLLLAAIALPSIAQETGPGLFKYQEYASTIKESREIAAIGDDGFGDETQPFNGSTEFKATDLSLPGNNDLPVEAGRRFLVEDRNQGVDHQRAYLGGYADWDIEVPYISGTFASDDGGWVVGPPEDANRYRRCSRLDPPYVSGAPNFLFGYVWDKNGLYIPGEEEGMLLPAKAGSYKAPTDGKTYPWVTTQNTRLRCLPQLRNGQPGEGFAAVTAKGVTYYFDLMVLRGAPRIRGITNRNTYKNRVRVFLLATRAEDRNGNWVNYNYSGEQLQSITASDGRSIAFTWANGAINTATGAGRTYTYSYSGGDQYADGGLLEVLQPDGTKWRYEKSGHLRSSKPRTPPREPEPCVEYRTPPSNFGYAVVHPSGARAEYVFAMRTFARSSTSFGCNAKPSPDYWEIFTLESKNVSGPGLAPQLTSYDYAGTCIECSKAPGTEGGAATAGAPLADAYIEANASDALPAAPPATDDGRRRETRVTHPDGTVTRYVYGAQAQYDSNSKIRYTEGLLLEETRTNAAGAVGSRRTIEYQNDPYATTAFPMLMGDYVYPYQPHEMVVRPVRKETVTQDGATFTRTVTTFDALARPLVVNRASSLGFSRNDSIDIHDNTAKWVLAQSAKTYVNGEVASEVAYDALARPLWYKVHGKLKQTLTYYAGTDATQFGTVATVKDGNNNVTALSGWKRGIPGTIKFADGVGTTAAIRDDGLPSSITDANGYVTQYGFDAMGRVNFVDYPDGDTPNWNSSSVTFARTAASLYGLPNPYWSEVERTGNKRKVTYYDSLWRPVVEETADAADTAGTRSIVVRRYDSANRVVFESYPMRSLASYTDTALKGVATTYDVLGRPLTVNEDSELGVLTTRTEYLPGFKTRVTNPRLAQTTTSYMAFDQPSTDWPVAIAHPEGAFVDIARDSLGNPRTIAKRNAGGTVRSSRHFVYNPAKELCKTIDPEAGSTVSHYDGAGNLDWSVSGAALADPNSCQETEASTSTRKVVRTYDNRNRLKTLVFPDGRGDQNWNYTADSLPSRVETFSYPGATPNVNAYQYNLRRFLKSETQTPQGQAAWTLGYGYDANGSLASHTYPSGLVVGYAPDALGSARQVGAYATGIAYHPNGAVAQFAYGNGIAHSLTQNLRGLPARSRDAYGATAIHDDSYAYDGEANVSTITDALSGARGNRTLTYDGLNRLTKAVSPMFGTASYAFDQLDNITRTTIGGPAARDHFYCYDGYNRLTNVKTGSCAGATVTGLGYDTQGNVNNKNGVAYDFDYGNKLRAIGPALSYTYDAYGRRITETIGPANPRMTRFMYSQSGLLVYETTSTTRNESIYLGDSLIARRGITTNIPGATYNVSYQHTDSLGSPVAVTDESRAVIERSEYEPFGRQIASRAAHDGPGFTGHRFDAASGLNYMQQRYFDPSIGRFLSADPVVTNTADGANFNRYWYGNNNPYKFTDANGQCTGSRIENKDGTCQSGGGYTTSGITLGAGSLTGAVSRTVAALTMSASSRALGIRRPGQGVDPLGPGILGTKSLGEVIVEEVQRLRRERIYVTYTLTRQGDFGTEYYFGRTSGYGDPQAIMMKRYAFHERRLQGFGNPTLDKWASGDKGLIAIRGREQQLIDAAGGIGTAHVANLIRGVSKWNVNGRLYHNASTKEFGLIAGYTGY